MFDVTRDRNAKLGPGMGLKIAVPSKSKMSIHWMVTCESICLRTSPRF